MLIDKACFERGCACYDSRDGDEAVEVVRKGWVELTDEDKDRLLKLDNWTDIVDATEAMLKEKNA